MCWIRETYNKDLAEAMVADGWVIECVEGGKFTLVHG